MKLLLILGMLAIGSTGLMADKCEINIPGGGDSTPPADTGGSE